MKDIHEIQDVILKNKTKEIIKAYKECQSISELLKVRKEYKDQISYLYDHRYIDLRKKLETCFVSSIENIIKNPSPNTEVN